MARSLGLAAYRALAGRGETHFDMPDHPRPTGELVWIHAGEPANMLAVTDFANRLLAARQDVAVLITSETVSEAATPDTSLYHAVLPSEHPAAVNAFLDHWSPDICIWVWGAMRPNLILEAANQECPLVLIDADTAGFDQRRGRWRRDATRQLLPHFSALFTRSAAGYRRLVQLGAAPDDVEQTSPLLAGGQVLACRQSDLTELSSAIGGRPVWFAAQILPHEIPVVLAAHKQALRLSHRLVLILQPTAPEYIDIAAKMAAERNMTVVNWDDGQFPDDITQVILAHDPEDRGLFFRIAPVSFLGSSLISGPLSCDPLDAAALGSAILYGPKVRHYLPSYTRLAAAGAARIVNDADTLGTAISRLIAPDQAATMAHAGWDVISEGAMMTDKVIDLIQDTLDVGLTRA